MVYLPYKYILKKISNISLLKPICVNTDKIKYGIIEESLEMRIRKRQEIFAIAICCKS